MSSIPCDHLLPPTMQSPCQTSSSFDVHYDIPVFSLHPSRNFPVSSRGWEVWGVFAAYLVKSNLVLVRPHLARCICNRARIRFKVERVITTAQSALIGVEGREDKVLNFCTNNYLGLADNAEVIAAAKATLSSHGHGSVSTAFFMAENATVPRSISKPLPPHYGSPSDLGGRAGSARFALFVGPKTSTRLSRGISPNFTEWTIPFYMPREWLSCSVASLSLSLSISLSLFLMSL